MNKAFSLLLPSFLVFLVASQGFAASEVATYDGLLHAIRKVRAASQARIEAAVEQEKVREAWETGKLIDEHVLQHKERAEYGEQVIIKLAKDLQTSETELKYMLQFARTYPIRRPADELSWSHYEALLSLNDPKERDEVTKEAAEKDWTRDQVRAEVRRRNASLSSPNVLIGDPLPEITPGPLYTYQIIRLKDRLKIDLGFGTYLDLPEKEAKKFREGDIIQVKQSSRGPLSVIASPPKAERPPVIASPPKTGEAISLLKNASLSDLYTYPALVTSVVDGDTFHALIDLGFGITQAQRVRLRRIDAPEILTAEGKEAKAYLEKILSRDCTARSVKASAVGTRTTGDECQGRILLQSRTLDQHGRPIADVWVKGKAVDQELLDKGYAVTISE